MKKRLAKDADSAYAILFGDPPVTDECWFDEVGLPVTIGWDRYRFEDACGYLQAHGRITLRYTAGGKGHVVRQ